MTGSEHLRACSFTQSCLTLWDPVDGSLPGSSVHGISQARILEWAVISSSGGSYGPRDQTCISCIAGGFSSHQWTNSGVFIQWNDTLQDNVFITSTYNSVATVSYWYLARMAPNCMWNQEGLKWCGQPAAQAHLLTWFILQPCWLHIYTLRTLVPSFINLQ